MKNMQCRRITAFVLAFCMVLAMPFAASAAQEDSTTLTLEIGQAETITVPGEYTESDASVSGTSAAFTYAAIQGKALSEGITTAEGFDGTKHYILITENNANQGMLTSEPYTATLSWSGVNITGLYTHAAVTADTAEVWTIESVNGGYAIRHNGQYLTFSWDRRLTSTGGLTSETSPLSMNYSRGYWFITNTDGHYLSNMGGDEGYYGASGFDEEGGSGWAIHEVVSDGTVSTVITVTGLSAGTTTLTLGGTTYTIVVRDPAAGHTYENGFCVDGQCDHPYERAAWDGEVYRIANGGQLYWFAQLVGSGETEAQAVLTADITVNTGDVVPERASCRRWTPIGIESSPFDGSFDGNGYTISGLYYNNGSENGRFVGLFGYIGENGSVSNVELENSWFCGRQDIGGIAGCNLGTITACRSAADLLATRYENVGGIAGYSKGILSSCTNSGAVTGVRNAGGIVGYLVNGRMTDCTNSGAVTQKGSDSACVGGIVGQAYGDVTMECCANIGAVSGESNDGAVGGVLGGVLLGNVSKTISLTSCYNTGAVSGDNHVGGILGLAKRSVVKITNSYSTGSITAADGDAGQIAGLVIRAGENAPSEISDCYYQADTELDEMDGTTAKTEAQFASGEVAYLLNGSSSEGEPVWKQTIGTDAAPQFEGKIVYRHEDGTYSNDEHPRVNPFTDVPEGSFYIEPVLWAVEKGITNGTTATTFDPNGQCMRAVVVTFLWRAAGSPDPTSKVNPFTDVKESDFFYKAVLWAVEKGITNGLTPTEFGPTSLCNRAQVVTFLWRSQGNPSSDVEVSFTDVKDGAFYSTAVAWAVEHEITNGISATEFGVNGICNRAQVVTFLYRTLAEQDSRIQSSIWTVSAKTCGA